MPPAAISQAMIAPKTPVAVAKGRGNDQIPAPTIEPTTIMVSANSESFCVCSDAAVVAAAGTSIRTCRLSISFLPADCAGLGLLHSPCAEPLIFLVGDRVRIP